MYPRRHFATQKKQQSSVAGNSVATIPGLAEFDAIAHHGSIGWSSPGVVFFCPLCIFSKIRAVFLTTLFLNILIFHGCKGHAVADLWNICATQRHRHCW
jgi:hypothetical protein